MKTHYAHLYRGNESNPYDDWGSTYCGLEYTESTLSNNINEVNCKTCVKRYNKEKEYEKNCDFIKIESLTKQ
jgi:thiaminase